MYTTIHYPQPTHSNGKPESVVDDVNELIIVKSTNKRRKTHGNG